MVTRVSSIKSSNVKVDQEAKYLVEIYCPDTHTHPTYCSVWTTKADGKKFAVFLQ